MDVCFRPVADRAQRFAEREPEVTRTYGVPAGPGAGEREAAEFADTLATVFEVLLVVGALMLARTAAARPMRWPTGALTATVVAALVVAGLTAASLMALAEL